METQTPLSVQKFVRKLSLARIAQLERDPGPWSGTNPEVVVAALLDHAGIEFESQRRFGRYVVDFYIPAANAVVEADGAYWHQDPERKAVRDAGLLTLGVSQVTHVTDTQLRKAGWL